MPHLPRAFHPFRATVAGWMVAQLVCVLALAAMPSWHAHVHPEAAHCAHQEHGGEHEDDHGPEEHDHECAVTLFLTGVCQFGAAPVVAAAPALVADAEILRGDLPEVYFSHRSRGIFEHAPPQRG